MAGLPIALVLALTVAPSQTEVSGRVVGVHDGDTITLLLPERRQVKIRLVEIDTPESRQPWGKRAKQALSDKVFGQIVLIEVEGTDRYGRLLGHVRLGERDINRELVAEGHAWVYRRYLRDRSLLDVEDRARRAGLGLWALPESQRSPPWDWRKRNRRGAGSRAKPGASAAAKPGPSSRAADPATDGATSQPTSSCGSKRRCGEMTTCQEARFYLQSCGVKSLDRDRDGIPCEALCR